MGRGEDELSGREIAQGIHRHVVFKPDKNRFRDPLPNPVYPLIQGLHSALPRGWKNIETRNVTLGIKNGNKKPWLRTARAKVEKGPLKKVVVLTARGPFYTTQPTFYSTQLPKRAISKLF